MNKLERLLNLTAALLETRRPMTADEIKRRIPGYPERDDSFRRTFERDKDDLREMGIPVEVVDVPGANPPVAGYRISPDRYYLADPGLEPDELAALQIATVSIRLGETDAELDLDAVRKLGGRVDPAPPTTEFASLPQPPNLEALFDAVTSRREVEFGYGDTPRRVQPHRLDFHKGRWYLSGFDTGREAERRYRLDRFQTDVTLGEADSFVRPDHTPGVMPDPWEMGEGEAVSARLAVDAEQLSLARNQLPEDTPWEDLPDGSTVATIRVVNRDAFRSFVLTFLDHAEVLEPAELREDLAGWLELAPGGGVVSGRITSSTRLRRILAIVPWVAERDGPTVQEICDRFAISRTDLLADLEVVFMVGIPPYTPDTLIDVVTEDDRVWIRLGDYFRRPLRLTPAEGLGLLAAGEAVRATPGSDPDGALARGLDKLATTLGVRTGEDGELDVSLGGADPAILDVVRSALQARHQIEIDYYSYGRDQHAVRVVDPYRLTATDGSWYLLGHCHQAVDERVFRLDRIASATELDTTFEPPAEVRATGGYVPQAGDALVTLRLAPPARWVVEHHPVESVDVEDDGRLVATMAVSQLTWLARLLIRLGPDAEVLAVEGGGFDRDDVDESTRALARSILARYRI